MPSSRYRFSLSNNLSSSAWKTYPHYFGQLFPILHRFIQPARVHYPRWRSLVGFGIDGR